jgi:hypothetical protein
MRAEGYRVLRKNGSLTYVTVGSLIKNAPCPPEVGKWVKVTIEWGPDVEEER